MAAFSWASGLGHSGCQRPVGVPRKDPLLLQPWAGKVQETWVGGAGVTQEAEMLVGYTLCKDATESPTGLTLPS